MSDLVSNVRTTAVVVRFFWRWFTGHELDGDRRTDATWRRKGSDTVHRSGHAWWWHFLPRWHRLGYRTGGTVLAILLAYGLLSDFEHTLLALEVALGLGLLAGACWVYVRVRTVRQREVARRIAKSVENRIKATPHSVPHSWVHVKLTGPTRVKSATLHLPEGHAQAERSIESLAKLVAGRAGLKPGEFDFEFIGESDRPRLIVRRMEVPPEVVDFEMARPCLEKAGNGRYFLGFGVRSAEMWIDLNQQAPHVAWSCGTGAGKTVAGRNLAAQIRREGGRVAIFDYGKEGESHGDWVYDENGELLPGIEFYDKTPAAHDALIALGEERSRRSTLAKEARRFRRPEPVFPRFLVIFEEMNTSIPELTAYWKRLRQEIKRDTGIEQPLESPAITAYRDLVCKGRSTLMNVLAVAQRFDANKVGGGDTRSNFSVRMLARFDDKARAMLIPEITPKPVSSTHPGRAIVCIGGAAEVLQGVYLSVDETRDWAFGHPDEAGRRYERTEVGVDRVDPVDAFEPRSEQGKSLATIDSSPVSTLPARPTPAGPVGLREAAEQRVVAATVKELKNARDRDPSFPEPVDKGGKTWLYARADLKAWEAQRSADVPVEMDEDAS